MTQPNDFDSPWNEALSRYLPAFLQLCFPQAHAAIDWTEGYRLLDQELHQVIRRATTGLRRLDLLAQVWRKDGVEAWVLVHISIVSFAVLADPDPHGHPNAYVTELWGCTSSQRLQGKIELVKELY